jgi:hypothetical protein
MPIDFCELSQFIIEAEAKKAMVAVACPPVPLVV